MKEKLLEIDFIRVVLLGGMILSSCLLLKGLIASDWKTVVVHSQMLVLEIAGFFGKRFVDKKMEALDDD